MTCRHSPGDPACSSHPTNVARHAAERASHAQQRAEARIKELEAQLSQGRLDAEKFEILDAVRVQGNLVLKVQYPSCPRCSYEGVKVLVYINVSEMVALRWRVIDPHFRAPSEEKQDPREAPSPAARFPASPEGWQDALHYAESQ